MTGATIRLRADERWLGTGLSTRRLSTTMALIALGSLVGHIAIVAGAALDTKPPPPPQQEISVEIVQDVPAAKPDAVKPQPAKPEAAKPEAAKLEATKLDAVQPEPPKPQPARADAAKPEPHVAEKAPPPAKDVATDERKLAALQQELDGLKAEQAQLQADRASEAAAIQTPAALRDTGLGPLPDSFQAVALPSSADGQGEATSYQEIVFSALAKAKGIGTTRGLPGTAGVRFSVDAAGHLLEVELVHPSGVASLDAEAVDIVHRAAPFPPPPQGAQRSFEANVTFKTQDAP